MLNQIDINRLWLGTALLFLCSLMLTGCNLEGVAAFSPSHDYVAVVSNDGRLYTTSAQGTESYPVQTEALLTGFDVSFSPDGERVLYAANVGGTPGICLATPDGEEIICPWISLPQGVVAGLLSFLPGGEFILAYQDGETWVLQVYTSDGGLLHDLEARGVEQLFLTANAYKVKRRSGGEEWSLRPHRASERRPIHWVTVQDGVVYRYSASPRLEGPERLGSLSGETLELLAGRRQTQINSAVLSPDGKRLAWRAQDISDTYSLYLLDLEADQASPVTLVSGADFRLTFAFSPDSQALAYESNEDGRSVWLVDADGSNKRKLADNASLPEWH